MRKIAAVLLTVLALCLAAGAAGAEEARDITKDCTLKANDGFFKYTMMTDGKYTTWWRTKNAARHPYITIDSRTEKIYGIYLRWALLPDAYEIQVRKGGDWVTVAEGDLNYAHIYYEIPGGADQVRIWCPSDEKQKIGMNELSVLGKGDVPDWVQRWDPPLEKADILFLATHPDDELIFLGGAIPAYADRGVRVAVAYMTFSNTTRRSELLNGLWLMGIRNYPVIGGFKDSYQKNVAKQYDALQGGKKAVDAWVVGLYRQLQPEVVVTQDANGEYGHPMHKILVTAAQDAYTAAAGDGEPESLKAYGPWQVKKLYLHLWKDSPVTMDWNVPLASMGGKTGLELAAEAFELHVTQHTSGMSVKETGVEYDNTAFGLYASEVGPDVAGGDFLEHIDVAAPAQPAAEAPEAPAEEPETPAEEPDEEPGAVGEPAEDAAGGVEAVEVTDTEPAAGAELEPDGPAAPAQEAAPAADAAAMDGYVLPEAVAAQLPALNSRGYLDEGEYILADETNGHYVYISTKEKIVIERRSDLSDKKHPLVYFVAHIWTDVSAGARVRTITWNPDKLRERVSPVRNANEHQVVFATNTDYYTYRIGGTRHVGVIVRDGVIRYDDRYTKLTTFFPNLDTLAFYADGHLDSMHSFEKSAQEYIDEGAYDVYSFGPCLVKDGELTERAINANNSYNPRMAIGQASPGHYVIILCEGRLKRSKGVQMKHLAELMMEEGCSLAVNMDGGQTAVFIFMGKQISQVPKINGTDDPRATNEILAVGTSSQVGQVEFK